MPTETLPRVFEIKQGHGDSYACKLMPALTIMKISTTLYAGIMDLLFNVHYFKKRYRTSMYIDRRCNMTTLS